MPDTYTTFLQEPEPKDREQLLEAYVKQRLQSLDRAIGGYTSVSLAGLTGNVDLTPTQAKYRVIKLTGAPSGAVTLRIPATTGANADIIIVNACTGSTSTVTVKSTGANAGNSAGVALVTGEARHVRHDGESAYGLEGSPTPWTALTLAGTWVNFAGTTQVAQYRKVGDRVELRGTVKNGTIPGTLWTLPTDFRPPADIALPVVSNGAASGVVSVTASTGVVRIEAGSNVSVNLDSVRFSVIP